MVSCKNRKGRRKQWVKGMRWMENKGNDKKKQILTGFVNILLGGSLLLSSLCMRGTDWEDFIAGVMTGVGCGCILVGVYVISRTFRK